MPCYYNENDPGAAEWLRNLIAAELIPAGVVDERSIRDVRPQELYGFEQVHFFAGISGWTLALRLAGWPAGVPVWTGSCPCQPFSQAGKRKGKKDPRHLWPEMRRLIEECGPAICFGEQVASKDGRKWLAGIRSDLEGMGYGVGASDLPAAGVGAPHIRQRLFWVAYAGHIGQGSGQSGTRKLEASERREPCQHVAEGGISCVGVVQPNGNGWKSWRTSAQVARHGSATEPTSSVSGFWSDFDILQFQDGKSRRVEPGTFPLAHGVPGRVGLLRGYGNAICPQVAAVFIESFLEILTNNTFEP